MTVSTATSRVDYTGNGVTVAFPVPFPFITDAYLLVIRTVIATGVSTTLTLDSIGADGYSVTGAGDATGTVTVITAPTSLQRLSIIRAVAGTQEADFVANDPFPAETFEDSLDKLQMQINDNVTALSRVPILFDGDVDGAGRYNAKGNRLSDLADGVSAQDAVTVAQLGDATNANAPFIQEGAGAVARTVQDKLRDVVSVADYGGSFDVAAQSAIDYLNGIGGGTVVVPSGVYTPAAVINMKSNVRVVCESGVVIDWTGVTGQAAAVRFYGSIGSDVALGANATRGSTSITTATDHGLANGDLIQIKGQRNALSSDAGEEWRLGFGTPSAPACYFAEFIFVQEVTAPTTFDILCGLMFPDYLDNDGSETDPYARPSTTIAKVTPIENAEWVGGRFINMGSTLTSAFRSDWAYNCRVRDVEVDKGQSKGSAVFWINAYACEAKNVIALTDAYLPGYVDADHSDYNRFKTAGSQACWFTACNDYNGSQPFDFSYFNLSTPSVQCGVRDSRTLNSRKNAMTSHPGSFMIDVINNHFLNSFEDGISIRSRKGKIIGNTVTSTTEADGTKLSYGLSAFEGWGRDNLFAGNIVDGFYYGIYEWDGGDAQERFTYSGNCYRDNIVQNCSYGFSVDPNVGSRNTVIRQTVFQNNTFKNIIVKFGDVQPYSPGVRVQGNHFYGPLGTAGTALTFNTNNPHSVVEYNWFYELGVGVVPITIGAAADTVTYPAATYNNTCVVRFNETAGAAGTISVNNTQSKPTIFEQGGRPGALMVPDGVTAPAALAGFAEIYVDTADGDLKVKFGDAVVKTLATDT